MLLTPRIVRTHELTQTDVSPIFIGTQQALGLGGPPPLIAGIADTTPPPNGTPAPTQPVGTVGAGQPTLPAGTSTVPQVPPGSSPIPGTTTTPVQPAVGTPPPALPVPPVPPVPTPNEPPPSAVTPPGATPQAAGTPATTVGAQGGGQIFLSPPGTDFRVGGGPYTVPVSITGASMVSGATLTITFNPSALRVRAIQEGSFMRSGGVNATFTQQVDAASGRIDIAIVRAGDATGVVGHGPAGRGPVRRGGRRSGEPDGHGRRHRPARYSGAAGVRAVPMVTVR